jgi:DNA-binding transcriptional ArsR family regulator
MSDQGIITALGHPLRARILAALDEHEASPKELSQALGEKLGNVSYHVRILAGLDLIELVRQTPRRGAVEHHYKSRPRPGAMVNVELDLDEAGWKAASVALDNFNKELTKISAKRKGEVKGRVVAAVLDAQGT